MGPQARDVLAAVTDADVSNAAFPFGHVREIDDRRHAGAGAARHLCRRTRLGTAHADRRHRRRLRRADGGRRRPADIRPVGYRALESLRLEKGYRAWGSDITPNDTPFEAGLGWAVKLHSPTPISSGAAALEALAGTPLTKRFAGFTVDDPDVVLVGRETILRNGEPVGYLTSGGYGYTVGKSIGYGYVRNDDGVTDEFLDDGDLRAGHRAGPCSGQNRIEPFFDPANAQGAKAWNRLS